MTINVGVSTKIKKKLCVQKNYIWNPSTCTCENGRYTRSIIDDSVITCDEIIEETNTVPTKSP